MYIYHFFVSQIFSITTRTDSRRAVHRFEFELIYQHFFFNFSNVFF